MDSTERAIATRNVKAKSTTTKAIAKKAAPKKAATKKVAAKAPRKTVNAGNCSERGCTFPAKRRGLCSGKGSNNHYRKMLRADKDA